MIGFGGSAGGLWMGFLGVTTLCLVFGFIHRARRRKRQDNNYRCFADTASFGDDRTQTAGIPIEPVYSETYVVDVVV